MTSRNEVRPRRKSTPHGDRSRLVPKGPDGAVGVTPVSDAISPEATRVLSAAVVLGLQFALDEVGEILCEQPGSLLRPMQEIMARGFVTADGAKFAFRDEATHGALYESTPEPVRLALHRQIGTRLLARGGPVAPAAHHLAHAAWPGDARVLAVLDRATREVLESSPGVAAYFAGRALDLTARDSDDRFARGIVAVETLVAADRREDAVTLARALIHEDPPVRFACDLHLKLASILVLSGDGTAAVSEVDAVVREPDLAVNVYAAAESTRLLARLAAGDFAQARHSAEATLAGEYTHRGDAALANALTDLSMNAWNAGHTADALSLMRGAAGRVDADAYRGQCAFVRLQLARMRMATGDGAGADVLATDDEDALDDPAWSIALAGLRARTHLSCGSIQDAIGENDRALALADELGTGFLAAVVRSTSAMIALLRDDSGAAGTQFAACANDLGNVPAHPIENHVSWIRARVLEATFGRQRAFEALEPMYANLPMYLPTLLEEPGAAAWLVRLALAQGDRRRAQSVVAAAEKLAADNRPYACISAIALHARGLLDRDVGALQQAASLHYQPWARASAAEDAGVALAELGRGDESRSHFAFAVSEYLLAGSERDASRVRARIRTARTERRTRIERPLEGWESLTDGERRVVALVAEGLTNRQAAERAFLSRHTVDSHLRQAYRKLNISSRVALVRLAMEHEPST
jgi:DNA-binding CsgD family transcriptional regulator